MSYNVIPTPDFKKFFKKLYKKYPSLKDDLAELAGKLEQDYKIGTSLGNNLYKIRLAIETHIQKGFFFRLDEKVGS